MNVKKARVFLIFVLLVASIIPSIQAPSDTASPSQSNDDAMRTGIGSYFGDTSFLTLQDEVVDIVTGIRFRGVDVPQGAKINNATLYVRSVYAYPIGEAYVTLTGDDADNSRAFNDSGSFNRIYTNAFKVWNVSDVFGTVIANVSITEIVQEIVDRPGWSDGNDLSLIMFSESGSPRREFISWDGNWEDPWIVVWFDEELTQEEIEDDIQDQAAAPFNDTTTFTWEKNDTYRGIDIYTVYEMGAAELLVVSSNNLIYFNTTKGDPNYNNWAASSFSFQSAGCVEFITTLGDWTYLIGQNNSQAQIFYSDDEFQTWQVETINDNFGALAGEGSDYGSILADQNGSDVIHVVFSSESDWNPATYDIIYTNFSIDPVTETLVWSTDYVNVTEDYATSQTDADMYQQKDGTLHIAWDGHNGTAQDAAQYRRRQANGTWLDAVRLSSDDAFDAFEVEIVANEDTGVAMAIWTRLAVGSWSLRWDVVFPNNTVGTAVGSTDRALSNSRYASAVVQRNNSVAHLVYIDYNGDHVEYRSKLIDNSTAWSGSQVVSGLIDRHANPVVALDEDNFTLAAVWWNFDGTETDWNVWQVGSAPVSADTLLLNLELRYPSMSDYFSRAIVDIFIFLVYPNGTLVSPDPLPEGVDPEDVIDDLLGGAQPEDPQEDVYTVIGKFQWKLLVLAVGMIMLLGSPVAGVYYGGDTATWIKILFIMFFGIGILWQIKSM